MRPEEISSEKNQEQNLRNEKKANYLYPSTKLWFYIPSENWFLAKSETKQFQGFESWFQSPDKIIQTINKPQKNKKFDINLADIKITKDPELLQMYYDLREKEYKKEWNFTDYSGQEEEFDKKSEIMLAFKGNEVIGGLRIGFSDTGYLSNEYPEYGFTYQEIGKKCGVDLQGCKYVEVSSVVIKKDIGRNNVLEKMLHQLVIKCRDENIKYIIGVSAIACNRDYQLKLKKLGVESLIASKIKAPTKLKYNNIEMCPIIAFP